MPLPAALISGLILGALGVFCIAKPDKFASFARRRYLRSSRFTQNFPFANIVMKSWYPTYLRCMGVFVLLFAAVLIYVAIVQLQ